MGTITRTTEGEIMNRYECTICNHNLKTIDPLKLRYKGKRLDNGEEIIGYYSYNSVRDVHMITVDNSGTNYVHPKSIEIVMGD